MQVTVVVHTSKYSIVGKIYIQCGATFMLLHSKVYIYFLHFVVVPVNNVQFYIHVTFDRLGIVTVNKYTR